VVDVPATGYEETHTADLNNEYECYNVEITIEDAREDGPRVGGGPTGRLKQLIISALYM